MPSPWLWANLELESMNLKQREPDPPPMKMWKKVTIGAVVLVIALVGAWLLGRARG